MSKKLALTVKEMEALIEQGIDVSDASMLWFPHNIEGKNKGYTLGIRSEDVSIENLEKTYPETMRGVKYAYTLDDILSKLPKYIQPFLDDKRELNEDIEYSLWELSMTNDDGGNLTIEYKYIGEEQDKFKPGDAYTIFREDNSVDTAYEALLWTLTHNFK